LEKKSQNDFFIVFAVIVFASLILRAPFMQKDVTLDESFSYFLAKQPINQMVSHDVHPPFYYILLKPFAHLIGNNIFILRFTSLILFYAFVTLLYIYMRKYHSEEGSLITTAFVLFSPTMMQFSTELRMYPLLLFLAMLTLYCLKNLQKTYILIPFVLGAMMWTHYFSIFFVVLICLYLFFTNEQISSHRLPYSFIIILFTFLTFVPSIAFLQETTQHIGTLWHEKPDLNSLISTFSYLITPPFDKSEIFYLPFLALMLLLFVLPPKIEWRETKLYYLLLLLPVIGFLTAQFIGIYHHRYFLYSSIGLYILAGYYAGKLDKQKQTFLIPLILMFIAVIFTTQTREQIYTTTLQESISFIEKDYPNDIILHTSTFSYMPYQFYYEGQNKTQYLVTKKTPKELFVVGGSLINIQQIVPDYCPIKTDLWVSNKCTNFKLYYRDGLCVSKT
jgi:uncharacterized membrane protein